MLLVILYFVITLNGCAFINELLLHSSITGASERKINEAESISEVFVVCSLVCAFLG